MTATPSEVQHIAALENPVLRNLEITYCYSRLAATFAERTGKNANWCTYATWASRQAGESIRGEDLLENLERRLWEGRWLLHPLATVWRRLLRRGLFQPETKLGQLTAELHTPFDAFERASDAVARGNLKVFAEIGLVFAQYLHEEPLKVEPGLLSQAFEHYDEMRAETDEVRRAQLTFLANLEIGLHEQMRLQPQIAEAMDAGSATEEDLGRRVLEALFPSAPSWWRILRGPATAVMGVVARALQRVSSRLAREAITDSLMVLSVSGRVLSLGANLADPFPPELADPVEPELKQLLARFEPVPPALDDCGARDWSDLHQRMHYIIHLFRAFQLDEQLADAPFTPAQLASISRGVIPGGDL